MTHDQAIRSMASERYLLEEMSELERYQFEAHYFDCLDCAEDVRLGAAIRQEVKGGTLGGSRRGSAPTSPTGQASEPQRLVSQVPAEVVRPAAWRRTARVALPWAAAAVLAVTTGYQAATMVPASDAMAPQALTPVMLRGASRGADPVVRVNPEDTFVALTLDVMADAATQELAYDLLSPASTAVISGRAPVPSSGAPLMLLVPADRLADPGSYTLVVRDAARADVTLGEYRFVAE